PCGEPFFDDRHLRAEPLGQDPGPSLVRSVAFGRCATGHGLPAPGERITETHHRACSHRRSSSQRPLGALACGMSSLYAACFDLQEPLCSILDKWFLYKPSTETKGFR